MALCPFPEAEDSLVVMNLGQEEVTLELDQGDHSGGLWFLLIFANLSSKQVTLHLCFERCSIFLFRGCLEFTEAQACVHISERGVMVILWFFHDCLPTQRMLSHSFSCPRVSKGVSSSLSTLRMLQVCVMYTCLIHELWKGKSMFLIPSCDAAPAWCSGYCLGAVLLTLAGALACVANLHWSIFTDKQQNFISSLYFLSCRGMKRT